VIRFGCEIVFLVITGILLTHFIKISRYQDVFFIASLCLIKFWVIIVTFSASSLFLTVDGGTSWSVPLRD
jgi:hypothetical protein